MSILGSFHDVSTSRMFESLEQLQESSSDEEEFFDAKGNFFGYTPIIHLCLQCLFLLFSFILSYFPYFVASI